VITGRTETRRPEGITVSLETARAWGEALELDANEMDRFIDACALARAPRVRHRRLEWLLDLAYETQALHQRVAQEPRPYEPRKDR